MYRMFTLLTAEVTEVNTENKFVSKNIKLG